MFIIKCKNIFTQNVFSERIASVCENVIISLIEFIVLSTFFYHLYILFCKL